MKVFEKTAFEAVYEIRSCGLLILLSLECGPQVLQTYKDSTVVCISELTLTECAACTIHLVASLGLGD